MRMVLSKNRVWGASWVLLLAAATADEPAAKLPATDAAPFGLAQRQPWTTSRITGSPDPPKPDIVERVFPQLSFENPVELMEQQTTSLMPDLLLLDMTAPKVADLLAYFTSLK
jgi:hypothetical protein